MVNFFSAHQVLCTLVLYYVLSAAISSMPSPDDKSGPGYKFLFGFAHTLAGNLAHIPQVRAVLGIQDNPSKP